MYVDQRELLIHYADVFIILVQFLVSIRIRSPYIGKFIKLTIPILADIDRKAQGV